MAKTQYKSAWFCSNCGNESAKWEGRCPACGEWNTMVEEKVSTAKTATRGARGTLRLQSELSRPQKVSEIQTTEQERITLPSAELKRDGIRRWLSRHDFYGSLLECCRT